jgi:hypothetical protein
MKYTGGFVWALICWAIRPLNNNAAITEAPRVKSFLILASCALRMTASAT